jgi:hypothetical protein
MARPLKGPRKDAQLVVRLEPDLRRRLDRVREALSKRASGVEIVNAHVVRTALERGLESLERELRLRRGKAV